MIIGTFSIGSLHFVELFSRNRSSIQSGDKGAKRLVKATYQARLREQTECSKAGLWENRVEIRVVGQPHYHFGSNGTMEIDAYLWHLRK